MGEQSDGPRRVILLSTKGCVERLVAPFLFYPLERSCKGEDSAV